MNPKSIKKEDKPPAIVWHRRDLRIDDNHALWQCLDQGHRPLGVFIFDTGILKSLPPQDRRVEFIQASVEMLAQSYAKLGCDFVATMGDPALLIPKISKEHSAQAVFVNRDYESYGQARDQTVRDTLDSQGVLMHSFKDHVIFERSEVKTGSGGPFAVFTPYKNAWLKRFSDCPPNVLPSNKLLKALELPPLNVREIPSLQSLGFEQTGGVALGYEPGEAGAKRAAKAFAQRIDQYHDQRNTPSLDMTSRLGVHFRFGTASVRRMAVWAAAISSPGSSTWLEEIIWRDFYSMIIAGNPALATGACYQSLFNGLTWRNDKDHIEAWKAGETGVPLVDAGMRQLAQTGFMHNRVRMVAASYFVKHLDCDWRIGEAHFASLLMDFDFASNNGGWQWCASTGCDAQPYFRIFNPQLQSERFDELGAYIARWVPELAKLPFATRHAPHLTKPETLKTIGFNLGVDYPEPLVDHATARKESIAKYAKQKA